MNLQEVLDSFPESKGAVVILSGGLDSSIAFRLAHKKYNGNIVALTFNYGQKQSIEIDCAKKICNVFDVKHEIIDASFLHQISLGFSANVDPNIKMPSIKEVIGDPRPKTYVPNRNMILMSIAASFAEARGYNIVITGLQCHDEYNYHDTTERFVEKVNNVLSENRITKIQIFAPFIRMSKIDELKLLKEIDNTLAFASYTWTCYDPVWQYPGEYEACGKCPSCSERINAFIQIGEKDYLRYATKINWRK